MLKENKKKLSIYNTKKHNCEESNINIYTEMLCFRMAVNEIVAFFLYHGECSYARNPWGHVLKTIVFSYFC